MGQHGTAGFGRDACPPTRGQQGKAEVRQRQGVAPHQAAHPDDRLVAAQRHAQQPVTVLAVARHGTFPQVAPGVIQRPYPAVTDEFVERGLVEQAQHEGRVLLGELPQGEAGGVDDDRGRIRVHGGRWRLGVVAG